MDRPAYLNDFADKLDALGDVELHDVSSAVASLVAQPGWAVLADSLKSRVVREQAALRPKGAPLEAAEYAEAHGIVGGLEMALAFPDAVAFVAAERATTRQAESAGGDHGE